MPLGVQRIERVKELFLSALAAGQKLEARQPGEATWRI